ncbi:GNAT family N-acetyltransferase [Acidiphilium sp. C61]|uniref:GNAT family N-acetyltransferase n=1 Tax=Acidiphilium sp. C61 TaxID=1671485 RepID=UPI00157BB5AE|nr:GNAT family N-acetyltransferase [Acidiphilium sp. C61]
MLVINPQCRRAEISEAAEIAQLLRSSIIELCVADHENREAPLQAWLANKTAANVETWICNPANIMLVAIIERRIGGVGCLRANGRVILNYVSPLYRFKGVSKAVLEALEQHGQALGLRSLGHEPG